MSSRRLRAIFGRAVLAVLLAGLGVAGVPSIVAAQDAPDQQADADEQVEVRIVAQRHDDDRVEFGLQLRLPGEPWSERALPAQRFFPPGTEVGRWLVSSPIALATDSGAVAVGTDIEVRVAAKRRSNDHIELALQQRDPGESWGEFLLPTRRFFPPGTDAGRWLASSPLGLQTTLGTTDTEPVAGPAGTDPPGEEEPGDGEPTTEGDEQPGAVQVSEDVFDVDMIDVHTGEAVNLRSVVNGETPLLFWLWSPY